MYFKITNQEECHHGYQYQTGLNLLDREFEPRGTCVAGGLYFTTLEHLEEFYSYGVWLRVVIIPKDARIVKDPEGDKWRANKIILGEKYPLFDVKTIQKFGLKVTEYYVNKVSLYGHIKVLDWLLKIRNESGSGSLIKFDYASNAVDWASGNNQLDVLDWWLKAHNEFGVKLKYSNWAITEASSKGHVKVLDWWLKAQNELGLEFKYNADAMEGASQNGHTNVLEWWLKAQNESGIELKYNLWAINSAAKKTKNNIKILDWWKSSGLVYLTHCD